MSEGHPKDIKSNWKGVNHNTEREISGSGDDGEYLEGKNGRITSIRGNNMSFEKIRGEEVLHTNSDLGNWACLGSIVVKDQLFEIWVDSTFPVRDNPIITVDGVVVAQAVDLPFVYEFPVQMDKNDNCLGGEVFITDNNTPPIIFDVKDMVDSVISDPTKYFADFNINQYTINLDAPLDIPIFKELTNVGGGAGLAVGKYQYALRYVNDDGDRTNFGPATPLIPVVRALNELTPQFPSVKTYGDKPQISSKTSYGIKLKFRVTNLFNYDYVEVKRLAYNAGIGADYVPVGEIVAKLAIQPGEISIREFIDPADSNVTDTLADDEELNDLSSIAKAKAIRYHDKRLVLMNIERASRTSDDVVFDELNGEKIFPILEHIEKKGHNDPFYATYKANYTGGERFSFGATLFDGTGSRGFAFDDVAIRNFDIPNRREEITGNSLDWSTSTLPSAANINSTVTKTFEAFDLHDAVQKTDDASFINILDDASGIGNEDPLVANKPLTTTPPAVPGVGQAPNNTTDPGFGAIVQSHELGYLPFTPVADNATAEGHNYRNILEVDTGSAYVDYNPTGFAPSYFSKGVAVAGLSNLPPWAKSFTINRSRAAGRVICQGLGMYSMIQGSGFTTGPSKDSDKMWFHSPDISSGLVGSGIVAEMMANPAEYDVQFISPLGFFSELCSYDEEDALLSTQDKLIDMVTYARVLHDAGEINPTEAGVGVSDYVAYNKYRNSDAAGGTPFNGVDGGNNTIQMKNFTPITNDRGEVHYEVELDSNIYHNVLTGGHPINSFEDAGMKDWTEPFYMINIVQNGKTIVDQNIDGYQSTGHYQKVESIIGVSDGNASQSFSLVDERWQDCIPDLTSGGALAADEVFVYIQGSNGVDRAWMNVEFLTAGQIALIEADILANGFYVATGSVKVYGLYNHTNLTNNEFTIDFTVSGNIPDTSSLIIVKYDNRRPLIVFGGDSSIGEAIFSPIDNEVDDPDDEALQFEFNAGFPFKDWTFNGRQYIVVRTTGVNKIQDDTACRLGFIRQMAVMFTCESRSSVNYAYNSTGFDQFFPLTNYVVRPNRWDDTDFAGGVPADIATSNNMWPAYFDDYPLEWTLWPFGGIRYIQNMNLDYAAKGPIEYFSKPDFGFEEENKFCTAVVWSLARAINQQDSPGLKTFLALNQFDITDDNGEIKFAWDAISGGKGENLYAICDSGICLLLTKKAILSNLNGTDLTTLASDSFISGEYWLSHDVGLSDEMWRGAAEGSIEIPSESGMVKVPGIYLPNKESVYRLYENQIKDIVKSQGYFDVISPYLKALGTGYEWPVTGFYNSIYNEYWLQLNSAIGTKTFTFAQNSDKWQAEFSYMFDQYAQLGDKLLGSRGEANVSYETWELDKGFVINGNDIEMFLTQNTTPGRGVEMEFIKVQVDSDKKPTKVEFLDEGYNVLCTLDAASKGPLYLKDYNGWEQFIPRKDVGVSADRERIQSRLLIYKIFHNLAEDFKVIESIVQYKKIK